MRISAPVEFSDANASDVQVRGGAFTYPDIRVEQFVVYVSNNVDGPYYQHSKYQAQRSERSNLSYAPAGTLNVLNYPQFTEMPNPGVENAVRDHDARRVLVSDVLNPRALRARRVQFVGQSGDDGVMGFAAHGEAVSQGQFGQYPLAALCRHSIWMMRQGGGDVAFESVEPISTSRGCVGRYAYTNVGGGILYASDDGVYLLQGDVPVSSPLHEPGNSEFLQSLGRDTVLSPYHRPETGLSEMWMAAGAVTLVYSLRHQRWTAVDRSRRHFYAHGGKLFGIKDGFIHEEGGSSLPQPYAIQTARMDLAAGMKCRIWRLFLRFSSPLESVRVRLYDTGDAGQTITLADQVLAKGRGFVNVRDGHCYRPWLLITGSGRPGQGISRLEVEYDARYDHRPRNEAAVPLVQQWSVLTGFN